MRGWIEALAVYRDRRVLSILVLGFSSGLPLALTGSTLMVWLTEAHIDIATIGLFALVGTPYSFKFVWAPLMDRLPAPVLSRLLGRRRGWIVATQLLLMAGLAGLGLSGPPADPLVTAAVALGVAFLSASQDIVIDAYRVEILEVEQYGAGAAMVQFGYRLGMLTSGAGALYLASVTSWSYVYAAMAAMVAAGIAVILLGPEPAAPPPRPPATGGLAGWMRETFAEPFLEMVRRNGSALVAMLGFIVLYKLGDALAGVIANPFYIQMGFSKAEVATVSKLFGFAATIIGTMIGGLMVARMGIARSLLLCGVLQMLSNLMFAFQATVGHDVSALVATIAIENLSGGMGAAAFVAYMSSLCGLGYAGTQYALVSSLAVVGRTMLASSGGWMVAHIGWVDFFLVSTVAALPGLALLLWMTRRFPANAETSRP